MYGAWSDLKGGIYKTNCPASFLPGLFIYRSIAISVAYLNARNANTIMSTIEPYRLSWILLCSDLPMMISIEKRRL